MRVSCPASRTLHDIHSFASWVCAERKTSTQQAHVLIVGYGTCTSHLSTVINDNMVYMHPNCFCGASNDSFSQSISTTIVEVVAGSAEVLGAPKTHIIEELFRLLQDKSQS